MVIPRHMNIQEKRNPHTKHTQSSRSFEQYSVLFVFQFSYFFFLTYLCVHSHIFFFFLVDFNILFHFLCKSSVKILFKGP